MANRPGKTFATLAVTAIVCMVAGLALGRLIKSPAQRALDTAPPPKSKITAPVEKPSTAGTVVTRGIVSLGTEVNVGPVKSSSAASIITSVDVKPGTKAQPGTRILEVSGRPVIMLPGDFPPYRDLKQGDSGPDAMQLNKALVAVGFQGPSGNSVTAATISALEKLYKKLGYAPPGSGIIDRREFVFIPGGSATVSKVSARVGGTAEIEQLVVLNAGETTITASLPPTSAETIQKGDTAVLDFGEAGAVPATVTSVQVGESATDTVVTLVPNSALPDGSQGQDVKVTIDQRLADESALVVPVSAVFSRADGSTVVIVVNTDGSERTVPVTPGPIVGSVVQVTPKSPDEPLTLGDEVLISGS